MTTVRIITDFVDGGVCRHVDELVDLPDAQARNYIAYGWAKRWKGKRVAAPLAPLCIPVYETAEQRPAIEALPPICIDEEPARETAEQKPAARRRKGQE